MPARKKPNYCACNNPLIYRECCRPLHRSERKAVTAEQLMRARYVAYVRKLYPYLHQTWAAETRPELAALQSVESPEPVWIGLEILAVEAGQAGDRVGVVEFNAKFSKNGVNSVLYERSLFIFDENRWFYLKAD